MTSTPKLDEVRAVKITSKKLETITISNTVSGLQAAVSCDHFDVISLDHQIDLYVDDEGAINGSPLNLPLTIIAHVLGTPTAIFGNAVALGVNNETGDSLSLTNTQVAVITAAASRKPEPTILDEVCRTLAPLPRVVAMLRRL